MVKVCEFTMEPIHVDGAQNPAWLEMANHFIQKDFWLAQIYVLNKEKHSKFQDAMVIKL